MKVNWSKSESRDVRPFFEVEQLAGAFSGAAIRLHDRMAYSEETSFVLNEQDIRRLNIMVRPALDTALVHACPAVKTSRLSVIVLATNSFLKRSRIVDRYAVDGLKREEISIGSEVLEALGGGANVSIDVCLYLNGELPIKTGRPYFPGHWLARKSFLLRSARLAEDFDVEPLDDDGWRARGLPAKTLYHVDYIGPMNEKLEQGQQLAKVYIHADVFRHMAAASDSKGMRAIQSVLAPEIICQILAASVSEWETARHPEQHSPLAALLKRINKSYKCDLPQLREMVQERGLQRLRAILQSDQETVRAIVEA
jgi:hypothetical protein